VSRHAPGRALAGAALFAGVIAAATVSADRTPQAAPPAPAQKPQQPPATFRAGVDLVALDVGVVDRSGRPVDDLKPADFRLRVDGRQREIVSAEFVSFRYPDAGPAPGGLPFSTNANRRPGRLIMIVVDEANIRRGAIARVVDAAAAYIDTLGPTDRVAVQIIPGTGPLVNFTTDHGLVKRILKTAVGAVVEADRTDRVGIAEAIAILDRPFTTSGPTPQGPLADLFERECPGEHDTASLSRCQQMLLGLARVVHANARARTTATMVALREVVERLTLTSDAKTVVLITEGVLLGKEFADVSWVADRTAAASVSFYALRVDNEQFHAAMARRSPTRMADRELLADGLNILVGLARGSVFPLSADGRATFARLNLELSGHYLLSFQPEPDERDGRAHEIAIGVTRSGLEVRSRRAFMLEAAPRDRPMETRLTEALRAPLLQPGIGIRTTTFTYRDDATENLKVLVGTEIDPPADAGRLGLAYYVIDPKGKIVATQVEPAIAERLAPEAPQHFTGAVVLPPGGYDLKLAVVDEQGRAGSVEHSFEARLTAIGQLRVGDLMLAAPSPGGGALRPSIDGRIAAETLVAYTEVYSAAEPQLAAATVTLEIAGSEDGLSMARTEMQVTSASSPGRRAAEGSIPLALLPPGSYVARAIVSSGGRPVGRVARPFVLDRAAPIVRTPVPAFDRAFVLTRPAVAFYLEMLSAPEVTPMPPSLVPAVGLARTGRFAQAAAIAANDATGHAAAAFLRGLGHLAAGELQPAVEQFGGALRASPSFFPAAFYLGSCYASAGRDREALIAWRAVPLPATPGAWTAIAMADAVLRVGLPLDAGDRTLLVSAMKAIYDANVSATPVATADLDRERFLRYADAYGAGPAAGTIAEWRRAVEGK
jgi:VWFA-related protein